MESLEFRLLNEFQRDFPLVSQPFKAMAEKLGTDENAVLDLLAGLQEEGKISRVGVVFRPNCVGASTLAAMAVGSGHMEEVADLVSSYREVNHNYERDNRFNLWFVIAAADWEKVWNVIEGIERRSGYTVMPLPLVEDYHIDLGFDLTEPDEDRWYRLRHAEPRLRSAVRLPLSSGPRWLAPSEAVLVTAIQQGFPLVPRPFAEIALHTGLSEAQVIAQIKSWSADDVVKRVGVIVRHRELGFLANAMVVWDVPDSQVTPIGARVAALPYVTLCYRRRRFLPDWPYNLYCMIHGRDRDSVLERIDDLEQRCGLRSHPNVILFSRRRFKQNGARYLAAV
ncbi:MAG: Lrp/AsnC family transcriptional regulator [Betaproteobacteria bacterium]|nr:Lrp/AsnC family transcriptional regulator [Betaproteobacteria bacterium]